MTLANDDDGWVTVLTTVPDMPYPRNTERAAVTTDRLLLRPLSAADLSAVHALRTDLAVMTSTGVGRVDGDVDHTRVYLERSLAPNDAASFNWAICLRSEDDALIGIGGCHRPQGWLGWPAIGYMLRSPYWGRGLAAEFLRAFLQLYEALPRSSNLMPLRVAQMSAPAWDGQNPIEEKLHAHTTLENVRSQRVLAKAGFEQYAARTEPDLRDPSKTVNLLFFQFFPGRAIARQRRVAGQAK